MISHGPIALLGGLEHVDGCEPIDRRMMSEVGASRPKVVVIPAASSRRLMAPTAVLARNYWRGLGASVTVGVPGGQSEPRLVEAVDTADIVVFTGGHPNKLFRRMGASPVLDQIIDRWENGMGLIGSSAGAMCLFGSRLNLYPPNPLKLIQGFGLLNGYTAAPHFDRFKARRWSPWVVDRLLLQNVIGLDEGTALIGREDSYIVAGRGNVTVVRPCEAEVHGPGSEVAIRFTRVRPTPRLTLSPNAVAVGAVAG